MQKFEYLIDLKYDESYESEICPDFKFKDSVFPIWYQASEEFVVISQVLLESEYQKIGKGEKAKKELTEGNTCDDGE